jgi:hypothetical protein
MTPIASGANVAVQFGAYGALLFRTDNISSPQRLRDRLAAKPGFASAALPVTAPKMGKGEFVRATQTGDATQGWTASATIAKGGVDTHLFLSFDSAAPLDLRGSDGLVLETTVPGHSQAAVELLVILHTSDGNDHIAGTGRMLSTPGTARTHVLFSHFRRAGWSKGPDVPLDLSNVTAIRVGWGGHIGVEGETIAFTVKPPERFSCSLEMR